MMTRYDPGSNRKISMQTPPPLGWVGVGWQRHYKTCRSLRELDNQPTVLFGHRSQLAIELDILCGVENLHSSQRGLSYHVVCLW